MPNGVIRKSAYIGKNVVLMPSFINVGAYVDDGTMIDTWSTVGSCAQIGKNCHISGGVGIGGVLEPLQANPVIIEDNCFIGARSEVAEGVIVGEGSVISMGVYLGASTKIWYLSFLKSYANAVNSFVKSIQQLGGANIGDKTMIDAQVPFAEVFESSISQGLSFIDSWNRAAIASTSAAKETANLTPKMGRARVLAEKSLGHPDPGATSFSLIVSSISSMFK